MWFHRLTGFDETGHKHVHQNILVSDGVLTSRVNGKQYRYGTLLIPSLGELRQAVTHGTGGNLHLSEVVADVVTLHKDPANAGALFQVASQFNLLEMVHPSVTPEQGIDIYERDPTQGPACAIACGAGTIYRNYFVPVNGELGQTADNQIDCLADVGRLLGNTDNNLWQMKNGYALATSDGMSIINEQLESMSETERDSIRSTLRVGIQQDTEVTTSDTHHTVSQIYCSALPVAYSNIPATLWEPFARLVLEATYEAALCAGIQNSTRTGNNKVYLTLVGGGAFGNNIEWILDAIERACRIYRQSGLDVYIVSRGSHNQKVQEKLAMSGYADIR